MVRSCRRSGRLWMARVEDEVLCKGWHPETNAPSLVLRPLRTNLRDGVARSGDRGTAGGTGSGRFHLQCGRTRPASTPRGRALRRGCTASPATARDGPDPAPQGAHQDRRGRTVARTGRDGSFGDLSRNFDVAAALSRLTPVHREVLVLAYFHGFSQREISDRTAASSGTVKSRTTARCAPCARPWASTTIGGLPMSEHPETRIYSVLT